jgi:hypothetical protein
VCAREAPGLQKVADELGVALVTVVLEGTRDGALGFVARTGLRAPVVLGDDAIAGHFHVAAYPWTVLVDKTGTAVAAVRGGRDEDQLRSLFREAL